MIPINYEEHSLLNDDLEGHIMYVSSPPNSTTTNQFTTSNMEDDCSDENNPQNPQHDSSSDEENSSDLSSTSDDEMDSDEDENSSSDSEGDDEKEIDLREWKLVYPMPHGDGSGLQQEGNSNITSPPFPPNQKLIELIGNESPMVDFSFVLQTRSDDPTPYIPDILYTSLVYQFYQSVRFHEKIRNKFDRVVADIKLVYSDNGEEVKKIIQVVEMNQTPIPANLIPEKPGGTSKDVLTGETKGLELVKPLIQREDNNSVMENRTKFNVDVVSFHYRQREFSLQIRYYFTEDYPPMDVSDVPFCVMQSASFTTFARRKNSQRILESRKRKKLQRMIDRKRERLNNIIPNSTLNTVYTLNSLSLGTIPLSQPQQPQATLNDFANGLKDLIYFSAVLPDDERRKAIDMALKQLVQNSRDI